MNWREALSVEEARYQEALDSAGVTVQQIQLLGLGTALVVVLLYLCMPTKFKEWVRDFFKF